MTNEKPRAELQKKFEADSEYMQLAKQRNKILLFIQRAEKTGNKKMVIVLYKSLEKTTTQLNKVKERIENEEIKK